MIVKKDSTNVSVELYIVDSTDGTPELGVLWNTAGIDLNYRRDGAVVTSITEATLSALTDAHSDGGFLEIANGRYRFDVPDAAFATGVSKVTIGGTVTGMVVLPVVIQLVDFDPEDVADLGLTNLDAAVSSRMATYTQPTGFLTATFPTTVASTTNITTVGTTTNLTNLPSIPANWITTAGITDGAFTAAKFAASSLDGKGDWVLASSAPTNWSSMGIESDGHVHADLKEMLGQGSAVIRLQRWLLAAKHGATQAGSTASTIVLDAGQSSNTDQFVGQMVVDLVNDEGRLITAYNGTTKTATVTPDWITTPGTADDFVILPWPGADIQAIISDAQSATDLKDFADAGYDPATNKVEGVKLVDTTTTNTDMLLATAIVSGGAITTSGGAVSNVTLVATTTTNTDMITTAAVNAEVDTALADIGLDHLISSALPTNWATDVASGSVFDNIADDGTAVYDRTTDSLQAISDSGGGGLTQQQVRDAMKLAPTGGAPGVGSVDEHLDDIKTKTDSLTFTAPGELDVNVFTLQAGVISNDSYTAGAITAAAIATNAIDADALAADAVTEIQSGLATSAALTNVQNDLDTITGTDGVTLATAQALYAPAKAGDNMGLTATATSSQLVTDVNATVDTALADIGLDHLISSALPTSWAVDVAANSVFDQIADDGTAAYDRTTDSLQAISDSGGGGLTQQQVRDAMKLAPTGGAPSAGSVDEHLDDVLADTAAMQPTIATNLDATVSSRMATTHINATGGAIDNVTLVATTTTNTDMITTAQVNTEVDTALSDIGLDHLIFSALPTNWATDVAANSVFDYVADDGTASYDRTTDSLQAISDSGGGGLTQQQVRDAMKLAPTGGAPSAGSVDEHLDTIETDTAALNDTKIPDTISLANINAQVDTALSDIGLDHLISVALPTNWATDVTANSVLDYMADDGTAVYDRTTDSLQAISDSGGGGLTQQQVRDAMKLAPTGGAPGAGSVDEHLDTIETDTAAMQPTIATNLDAAVSTRMATTHINATGGAVDNVTLVATTTTNTDQRGTDNALLAASAPTNFSDLAITVTTGQVTVGTNNDKTGYSISGAVTTLDALNDIAATDIVSAGPITTLAGAVVNVDLVDTLTTYTGNTPQTADHTANISAILTDTGTTLDDHLTDIKGTAFVKDTHSLTNIEGYVDLIDDGTSGLAKIATDAAAILVDTTAGGAGPWTTGGGGGGGTGAWTISVTVDDGTNPLENATVRFTEGANTYSVDTDVNGLATFNLDTATYTVAIFKFGYTYAGTTNAVSADASVTYSMTQVVIPASSIPNTVNAYIYTYDETGVLASIPCSARMVNNPEGAGIGYVRTLYEANSDASGLFSFTAYIGGSYDVTVGGVTQNITIPLSPSDPFEITNQMAGVT